jgi:hypothetical protein
MQIAILLIAAAAGAALGLRFKVLVLVPAIGIAAVLVPAICAAHGVGGWLVAWQTVLAALCLQIGYFGGLGATRFAAGTRRGEIRRQ